MAISRRTSSRNRAAPAPHPVRRRRRLRLQGPARRAGAGAGRLRHRPRRRTTCWSGSSTATTARWSASTPTGRSSPPPTSSPRSSTTSTTGAGSRRPTRSPTSTRWAASRWWRVNLLAWPRDLLPFDLAAEVLRGGAEVCARGRLPRRRRPQHRRPRAEVRPGGDRASPTPSGCCATTPASPASPLTLTKPLGLGILNNRAQGDRRVVRRGGRDDDGAQPRRLPGRGGRRGALRHRRHRFRAAGPPAQAVPGQRRRRRSSTARPCRYLDGARASLRRRLRPAAARGATWTGCARPQQLTSRQRGRAAAAGRRADLRRPAGRRRAARPPGDRRADRGTQASGCASQPGRPAGSPGTSRRRCPRPTRRTGRDVLRPRRP